MPLSSQAESLQSLEQEERSEGVHAWAQVSQVLDSDTSDVSYCTECLVEVEAVIAFVGSREGGESGGVGPLEFS